MRRGVIETNFNLAAGYKTIHIQTQCGGKSEFVKKWRMKQMEAVP